MLKNLKLYAQILFFPLFQSCISTSSELLHYHPYNANTLKLREKKDLKIAIDANNPIYFPPLDTYLGGKIAYSPLKKLGLQLGYYQFYSDRSDDILLTNDMYATSFSIGYYHNKQFAKRKRGNYRRKRKKLQYRLIELYGGTTVGEFKNSSIEIFPVGLFSFREEHQNSNLNFQQYFINGGLHYQFRLLSIGMQIRSGFINYYKGSLTTILPSSDHTNHYLNIVRKNNGFFLEPTFRCAFGKENFNGFISSSYFTSSKSWDFYPKRFLLNFGFSFDINGIYHELTQLKKQR